MLSRTVSTAATRSLLRISPSFTMRNKAIPALSLAFAVKPQQSYLNLAFTTPVRAFATDSAKTAKDAAAAAAAAPAAHAVSAAKEAQLAAARLEAEVETARADAIAAASAGTVRDVNLLKRRYTAAELEARAHAAVAKKMADVKSGAAQPKTVDEIIIARKAAIAAGTKQIDAIDEAKIDLAVAQHLSKQIFITGPNNEAVPLVVKPSKHEIRNPKALWERNKQTLISQGRYHAVPESELRARLQQKVARKWGLLGRIFPFLTRLEGKHAVYSPDSSKTAEANAKAAATAFAHNPEASAILSVEQAVQTELRAALDEAQARAESGRGGRGGEDRGPQFPVKTFLVGVAIMLASYVGLTLYDFYMEFTYGILPPGKDFD